MYRVKTFQWFPVALLSYKLQAFHSYRGDKTLINLYILINQLLRDFSA